ncbi:hypothetical protein [Ralstonia sp. A12]|uniref:hypothetical protein n=1 Tax=Ralstonia sp. A12 TaxID=1217052 RepID=UPI0012EE636C|nr:hypothetical protein [Ralstonia sp. A12]
MTFFWVICVVMLPYTVAIFGNFYAVINPWKVLVDLVEFMVGRSFGGVLALPTRGKYWPALIMYMALIYIELFSQISPFGLSWVLTVYAIINVGGAWLFGKEEWLRHGEFFGVMLQLIGKFAPIAWEEDSSAGSFAVKVSLRRPMLSLIREKAEDTSHVVFILFMLSSTGFDGLHETVPWVSFFWAKINPYIAGLVHASAREQLLISANAYLLWQRAMLFFSPFIYLLVFMGVVGLVARIAGPTFSVREMTLRLAPSLVPIALVYHVAHYFTMVFSQGGQIVRLISDPFGAGWNLFGTAKIDVPPIMFDLGTIWHTQVAIILLGHIAGVILAHIEAVRSVASQSRALLGQLPVLALMVVFTTMGLWILSLPLAPGQ